MGSHLEQFESQQRLLGVPSCHTFVSSFASLPVCCEATWETANGSNTVIYWAYLNDALWFYTSPDSVFRPPLSIEAAEKLVLRNSTSLRTSTTEGIIRIEYLLRLKEGWVIYLRARGLIETEEDSLRVTPLHQR